MLHLGIQIEWDNAMNAEVDNMGNTAITFIILFLTSILFIIGTTAFKVKMSLQVGTDF